MRQTGYCSTRCTESRPSGTSQTGIQKRRARSTRSGETEARAIDHVRSVGSTRWARSMSSRAAVRPAPGDVVTCRKVSRPTDGRAPYRDGMTSTTADILGSYLRLAEPFGSVVDRVPAAGWDAPSPCEGWSARDVLAHVITSQRGFLAQRGVDATTSADLDTDRSTDPGARLARPRRADARAARRPGRRRDGVRRRLRPHHGGRVDRRVPRLRPRRAPLGHRRGRGPRRAPHRRRARHARPLGRRLRRPPLRRRRLQARPGRSASGADRQERVLARLGRRTPASV